VEKLVAAFRTVNLDGLPSLASMSGDRERILWVLLVAKEKLDERHLTAPQASAVLRDVYGIHVPWQRAQAILAGERDTVAAQRRAGRRYYQLMQPGTQAVVASGPDVVFIEPDKALSGIRSAQAVMQSLVGTVRFVTRMWSRVRWTSSQRPCAQPTFVC
jgi:hypothetical protein